MRDTYVVKLQTVQSSYPEIMSVSEYLVINHSFSLCLQDFRRRSKILKRDHIQKSKLSEKQMTKSKERGNATLG